MYQNSCTKQLDYLKGMQCSEGLNNSTHVHLYKAYEYINECYY